MEAAHVNKLTLAIILLVAFFLYGICLPIFYVGAFTDDALFLALAQALLHGTYRSIYSPLDIPVTDPLPGFPLLLAPLVGWFGPTSPLLHYVSILSFLGAGFLLASLCLRYLPRKEAFVGLLLFLFNPTLVRYAGTVLAEPAYVGFMMLAIWLLTLETSRTDVLGGLVLGWCALLRPQGVLLMLAVTVHWALTKRCYRLKSVLVLALLPLLLFMVRNYWTTKTLTGYLTNAQHHLSLTDSLSTFGVKFKAVLGMTFPDLLFQLPGIQNFLLRRVVAWTVILGTLGLTLFGTLKRKDQGFLQIGALYVGGSLLALPFWFALDKRYLLVLLPFLVILLVNGTLEVKKRIPSFRYILPALGLLFLSTYTWGNFNNLKTAWSAREYPLRRGPMETFRWLQKHVAGERILSEQAATVYLYTGILTMPYFEANNQNDFLNFLRRHRIHYFVMTPGEQVMMSEKSRPQILRSQIHAWITNSGTFEALHQNLEEGTEVFRLQKP